MNPTNAHFRYNATIKNEQDITLSAASLFPGMSEVSLQSRVFDQYADCVKSCKGLLEDVMNDANAKYEAPVFKLGAEVNPKHSGTPTISKDWTDAEVARFWVFDRSMEGTGRNIAAICRGSIFAIPKVDQGHNTN